GARATSTVTWGGTRSAKRGCASRMPARVAASWGTSLVLSMKARSRGPARSTGATLSMRRSRAAPARGSAPMRTAVSPPVTPAGRLKKWGSVTLGRSGGTRDPAIMPPPRGLSTRPPSGSELGAAAEADRLCLVAGRTADHQRELAILLGDGLGVIEPQRPEGRIPHGAGADRCPDLHAVLGRRGGLAGEQRLQLGLAGTLVIPQRADVGEHGEAHADILGHAPDRELQLGRGAPVLGATESVVVGAGGEVARSDTGGGEAAHQIRAHEEVVEHAQARQVIEGH